MKKENENLFGPEALWIVELDERREFTFVVIADDSNIKCNDSTCSQDAVCPRKPA
jgi:hypothetical protein